MSERTTGKSAGNAVILTDQGIPFHIAIEKPRGLLVGSAERRSNLDNLLISIDSLPNEGLSFLKNKVHILGFNEDLAR
jgi:hypothetical protein